MPDHPTSQVQIAPELTPEQRGAQLLALSREIDREQFWDTVRTLLWCFAWSVAGVLAMGWSFASTDERWAPVIFWGALTAANAAIWFALLAAFKRSLERTGEG